MRSTLLVGYLLAPVKDGGGDGNVRGWLSSLQANFRLAKNLLRENDALTAGLKVEILRPGDYYPDNDLAYYARWELAYSF